MIKLKIVNKDSYVYDLEDEQGNKYTINLEFVDVETPKLGGFIYINKELLNPKYEGYSTSYTFGNLDSKYGKEDIQDDDIDVIKIISDELEISLKRLYG